MQNLSAQDVINALDLKPHVEGGYFRRTFQADQRPQVDTPTGRRYTLTSIFYMLTADSPRGHFHRNQSDILHFFQGGDPLTYFLIHADGGLETVVMGPNIRAGQVLQLTVTGGIWKASELKSGGCFGLVSEAVAPGFDYVDMTLGSRADLALQFPQHESLIERLARA